MLVSTPLTTYQIQTTETEHDRFLEPRHEHTHETDTGKVADVTLPAPVINQGHTELIPVHIGGLTITKFHATGTHVGDKTVFRCYTVTVGIKDLRTDAHLILEETLKLIQREIEIDILHIRSTLITGIVRLRLVVCVRRVALWIVDALITIENALLLFVEIRATEIMVVVASRVVTPCLDNTVFGDHATVDNSIEPLLIGAIAALFGIVQTIESHILQVT